VYFLCLQPPCLFIVRRLWQFRQTISHFFISAFMVLMPYPFSASRTTLSFFSPLTWSNSNTLSSVSPQSTQQERKRTSQTNLKFLPL